MHINLGESLTEVSQTYSWIDLDQVLNQSNNVNS